MTGAIGSATVVTAWVLFCDAFRFWRDTSEPTMPAARIKPTAAMTKRFVILLSAGETGFTGGGGTGTVGMRNDFGG